MDSLCSVEVTTSNAEQTIPVTSSLVGNKPAGDDPEKESQRTLQYHVTETPPIHLLLFFSFQQVLTSIATSFSVTLIVAELICAPRDEIFKSKMLCTTMFMSGLATLLQCLFGSRLPLYQGPAILYVIPLIAMTKHSEWSCPTDTSIAANDSGSSPIVTNSENEELSRYRLQQLMGPLMIAGVVHTAMGAFGLVGWLIKFIGPVTIVPTLTLTGLVIYKINVKFAESHWGVALATTCIAIILSLYMDKKLTPIPFWTKKRGFHIIYSQLHRNFALLVTIGVGWLLSFALTEAGVFSDDPKSVQYFARTDTRNYVIREATWIYFPYPFQFGFPQYNSGALVSFLVCTAISLLDSVGDYYTCATTTKVPPPPKHAINRGIAVEGLSTFLSGIVGAGHATFTHGSNIGIIGITKVASRSVFVFAGVIFMIFGILGKLSAALTTIPYSILGGVGLLKYGVLIGIVLSNMKHIDMSSMRNLAIIGFSLIVGLSTPYALERIPDAIQTGNDAVDRALTMIIANPNFSGGFVACFLDNTVPGTLKERGMISWLDGGKSESLDSKDGATFETVEDVYGLPFLPKFISESRLASYIPFLPSYGTRSSSASNI